MLYRCNLNSEQQFKIIMIKVYFANSNLITKVIEVVKDILRF